MKKVRDLLNAKADVVHEITDDTTVFLALEQLVDKNIGALVVRRNGEVAGLFSERDYARKVVLKGKSSRDTLVREIMNERPVTVCPEDTIEHCMGLMTDKLVRYLLVYEQGELKGILSIGDLVKHIIADQQHTIDHLQNYIQGS
jgi:CBS domain-containing protein